MNFQGNSEFRVQSLYAYIQLFDLSFEQFEMASFVFCLKRNSAFYVFVLIMPMYFCNVILIFGLFQPVTIYDKHRPDKFCLGMATLGCFLLLGTVMTQRVQFSTEQPLICMFFHVFV